MDREGLCERGQWAEGDGVRQLPHGQGPGRRARRQGELLEPRLGQERHLSFSQMAFHHQVPPPNPLCKHLSFIASQAPSPQQPTTSFLHRREKPICSSLLSSLGESFAPFRGQSLRKEVGKAKDMSLTFDIKQSMLPVSAWLISCVTLDKSLSLSEPQQGK